MICGVMQINGLINRKEYDYIGVMYPEGYMSEESQYLFNHEDIEEIVFFGFDDDERTEFLDKLDNLYKNKR